MKRGDVVIVYFPFSDRTGSKRRPALVVQADALNRALRETILASISTTARGEATHVLLDLTSDPKSGLNVACGIRCEKLLVVDRRFIRGPIGQLTEQTMRKVDEGLKRALSL